jgi:hypothetical protein
MEDIYGVDLKITDFTDKDLWLKFVGQKEQIPSPQINSTFVE